MQNTSCEPSTEAATATAPEDEVNAKYRQKYRRLKRYMKDLVFENATLCDHIAQVQEKISQRSEERRFMLKKLLDIENELETQLGRPCSKLNELIASSLPPKRQYKKREKNATPNGTAGSSKSGDQGGPDTQQQDTQGSVPPDGVIENGKDDGEESTQSGSIERKSGEKNGSVRMGKKRGPHGNKGGDGGSKVRRKARMGGASGLPSTKKQRIPVDSSGHPSYPITIGCFTVHNLGEIVTDRPAYHTDCTIYPIGYTVTRPYGHYKDPEKRCNYTCRIVDDGERPRFEIVPECTDPTVADGEVNEPKGVAVGGGAGEEEDGTIGGPTTDGCHAELLQRINTALNIRSIDVSRPLGDWFFGLAHPTIANLIQGFPSAKRCANYRGGGSGTKRATLASAGKENDPTLSYDALVRHITIAAYRTVPEIKEEPPDELFDHSDGNSFSLSA